MRSLTLTTVARAASLATVHRISWPTVVAAVSATITPPQTDVQSRSSRRLMTRLVFAWAQARQCRASPREKGVLLLMTFEVYRSPEGHRGQQRHWQHLTLRQDSIDVVKIGRHQLGVGAQAA